MFHGYDWKQVEAALVIALSDIPAGTEGATPPEVLVLGRYNLKTYNLKTGNTPKYTSLRIRAEITDESAVASR